jgi:hypothetical protein
VIKSGIDYSGADCGLFYEHLTLPFNDHMALKESSGLCNPISIGIFHEDYNMINFTYDDQLVDVYHVVCINMDN